MIEWSEYSSPDPGQATTLTLMTKKKYQKITARTLEHALLWGDHMCKLDSWNKTDANVYTLIKDEVKRIRNERYLKRRAVEANPYIDSSNPYHTT